VRALATRELELGDYLKVLRKELGTGLLLGVAFGTFITGYVLLARGLAVGGPYQVSVPSGGEYATDTVDDIFLELDDTEVISLTVRPASFEEITVTADDVGAEVTVGVARDFDEAQIQAIPSIARDFISTLAVEPKIVVDNSEDRGPSGPDLAGPGRHAREPPRLTRREEPEPDRARWTRRVLHGWRRGPGLDVRRAPPDDRRLAVDSPVSAETGRPCGGRLANRCPSAAGADRE
jgi:hypothetical protein